MKKLLYWAPRAWAILFIIAASLLAFFDSKTLADTLLQLVPSGVTAVALLLAWKWEMLGGIVLVLFGFSYILLISGLPVLTYALMAGIPMLIGVLLILNSGLLHLMKDVETLE